MSEWEGFQDVVFNADLHSVASRQAPLRISGLSPPEADVVGSFRLAADLVTQLGASAHSLNINLPPASLSSLTLSRARADSRTCTFLTASRNSISVTQRASALVQPSSRRQWLLVLLFTPVSTLLNVYIALRLFVSVLLSHSSSGKLRLIRPDSPPSERRSSPQTATVDPERAHADFIGTRAVSC